MWDKVKSFIRRRELLNKYGFSSILKLQNYQFYFSPSCEIKENLSKTLLLDTGAVEKVFKTRKRRSALWMRTSDGTAVLIKKFFLLRHKKIYFTTLADVHREVFNHSSLIDNISQDLTDIGVRTPRIFGYYEKLFLNIPVECGILMEFLEGFDQMPPEQSGKIAELIVALHLQGFYHGDISTKNVLKNKNGEIALIDFSYVSRYSPEKSLHYLVRMAGCFLYSTAFLFPEFGTDRYRTEFVAEVCQKLTEHGVSFDSDKFSALVLKAACYAPWKPIPDEIFGSEEIYRTPEDKALER